MTMFDGLVFDLDGTLWDSSLVCAEAWNTALKKLRIEHRQITTQDIGGIMGMPHQKIYETVFPDSPEQERALIADQCEVEAIAALEEGGAVLYEGVAEGIPLLAKKFPLYIVSNCQVDYIECFFQMTGFGRYIKDWECHGRTLKSKAHNIKALVERNQLKRAVYVGDTGSDQEAALLAGIAFVFVTYGFGRPSKPCDHFSSFTDLANHFLKS